MLDKRIVFYCMQAFQKKSKIRGRVVLKKTGGCLLWRSKLQEIKKVHLLGGSVLGDGLGALRHGVLGELTREQQADSSLDLARGDGGLLVVLGKLGGLVGDFLEDVVHERVHDGHGLGGDTSVGVHLLQHLVDVHRVRLLASDAALLRASSGFLLGGRLGLHNLIG